MYFTVIYYTCRFTSLCKMFPNLGSQHSEVNYSARSRSIKYKYLPGIEEITKGTGTHKHTETESRYFDWHGRLPQSKESKCL